MARPLSKQVEAAINTKDLVLTLKTMLERQELSPVINKTNQAFIEILDGKKVTIEVDKNMDKSVAGMYDPNTKNNFKSRYGS